MSLTSFRLLLLDIVLVPIYGYLISFANLYFTIKLHRFGLHIFLVLSI